MLSGSSLGALRELVAVEGMLSTIQDMKFCLRTGFGDSKAYASATGGVKTQGLCHGNGAAPAGWAVTSIAMIQAHKRKGRGVHLYCPISKKKMHLAGTLFVDNTDLEHFDVIKNETVLDAHEAMQTSILNWGRVLIATGGTLKPSKCFYHLISFSWKPGGSWRFDQNEKKPELSIMVPLSNGSHAPIEHLEIPAPTKTLGSMTCPTECSNGAIAQMIEKAQGWIDRARSGKLQRNLWFLLDKQFWPKVSFGISSITAPFDVLEECLMKTYFSMLSLSSIYQSVSRDLCQMDRGFYGAGFPHPGVKCFVLQMNKLRTHYGSNTRLGIHMQLSMELLITEAGISLQPLSTPLSHCKGWVTHCWLKLLWEKVDMFLVCIEILELPLKFPREQDNWLMAAYENADYDGKALVCLNRVRCYQHAIFISGMLDASRKGINRKYLMQHQKGESWSTLIFLQEKPPDKDFKLWENALLCIALRGQLQDCIGKFVERGHKIWEGRYDEEEAKLHYLKGAAMDVYTPSLVPRHTRRAN
jgi:hypothetical protein